VIAALAVAAACTWNAPGVDPFMGSVPAAVDAYRDIPADVRAALKLRLQRRTYDTVALITRDEIIAPGGERFGLLRDMHFGNGKVCREVSRAGWTDSMQERGLVYCEQGHCLIVPTVCRNVSRVTRVEGPAPRLQEIPGGTGGMAFGWTFEPEGDDGSWLRRADREPLSLPVPVDTVTSTRAAEPIPEPSTFAMFVASLAVLGFYLLRRTRKASHDAAWILMPRR
jgi:hypothetical protein